MCRLLIWLGVAGVGRSVLFRSARSGVDEAGWVGALEAEGAGAGEVALEVGDEVGGGVGNDVGDDTSWHRPAENSGPAAAVHQNRPFGRNRHRNAVSV